MFGMTESLLRSTRASAGAARKWALAMISQATAVAGRAGATGSATEGYETPPSALKFGDGERSGTLSMPPMLSIGNRSVKI